MQAVSTHSLIERAVAHPAVRSGYTSLLVHLLAAIALALLAGRWERHDQTPPLLLAFAEDRQADQPGPVAVAIEPAAADLTLEPPDQTDQAAAAPDAALPDAAIVPPDPPEVTIADAKAADHFAAAAAAPDARQRAEAAADVPGDSTPRPAAAAPSAAADAGPPFAARRGAARAAAIRARGGSAASEKAVELGLAWLARHQAVDGSWQFDLSGCQCNGGCGNPGTLHSSTASTGIALLPFLGAGATHVDGPYQQTVSRAIYYLLSRMQPTPRGGDFCEGTMYGHGVTTLALAEAYGMTGDEMLVPYLRDAIRFIQTAQDPHGGGWRYLPGQAGDTTVTAWQVAALKSAAIAGIETPSPTIDGVRRFLDRVQANNGAAYGYRSPQAKPCTSAIGLLCRMYTGWGPEHEALSRGASALAKAGPRPDAVYQNFYLAQVLLQMNHPVWPRWNGRNRDQLVTRQARVGHEAGSWFFADPDTAPGGRLAHTALAILTLEVYYRLLPIYKPEAIADTF